MEPQCQYCELRDDEGPCSVLLYHLREVRGLKFQGEVSPGSLSSCSMFEPNQEARDLDAEDAAAEAYLTRKQRMEEEVTA